MSFLDRFRRNRTRAASSYLDPAEQAAVYARLAREQEEFLLSVGHSPESARRLADTRARRQSVIRPEIAQRIDDAGTAAMEQADREHRSGHSAYRKAVKEECARTGVSEADFYRAEPGLLEMAWPSVHARLAYEEPVFDLGAEDAHEHAETRYRMELHGLADPQDVPVHPIAVRPRPAQGPVLDLDDVHEASGDIEDATAGPAGLTPAAPALRNRDIAEDAIREFEQQLGLLGDHRAALHAVLAEQEPENVLIAGEAVVMFQGSRMAGDHPSLAWSTGVDSVARWPRRDHVDPETAAGQADSLMQIMADLFLDPGADEQPEAAAPDVADAREALGDVEVVTIDPSELMPAVDALQNYDTADSAVGSYRVHRAGGMGHGEALRAVAEWHEPDQRPLAEQAIALYAAAVGSGDEPEQARRAAVAEAADAATPRISAEQVDQIRAAFAEDPVGEPDVGEPESMTVAQARDIVVRAEELTQHLDTCSLGGENCPTCSENILDASGFWDHEVGAARARLADYSLDDILAGNLAAADLEDTVPEREPDPESWIARNLTARHARDHAQAQAQEQSSETPTAAQAAAASGGEAGRSSEMSEEQAREIVVRAVRMRDHITSCSVPPDECATCRAYDPSRTDFWDRDVPAADAALADREAGDRILVDANLGEVVVVNPRQMIAGAEDRVVGEPEVRAADWQTNLPEPSPVPEREPEPGSWIARNLPSAEDATPDPWDSGEQEASERDPGVVFQEHLEADDAAQQVDPAAGHEPEPEPGRAGHRAPTGAAAADAMLGRIDEVLADEQARAERDAPTVSPERAAEYRAQRSESLAFGAQVRAEYDRHVAEGMSRYDAHCATVAAHPDRGVRAMLALAATYAERGEDMPSETDRSAVAEDSDAAGRDDAPAAAENSEADIRGTEDAAQLPGPSVDTGSFTAASVEVQGSMVNGVPEPGADWRAGGPGDPAEWAQQWADFDRTMQQAFGSGDSGDADVPPAPWVQEEDQALGESSDAGTGRDGVWVARGLRSDGTATTAESIDAWGDVGNLPATRNLRRHPGRTSSGHPAAPQDTGDGDSEAAEDPEPPRPAALRECEQSLADAEDAVHRGQTADEDDARAERCARWNHDDEAAADTDDAADERG